MKKKIDGKNKLLKIAISGTILLFFLLLICNYFGESQQRKILGNMSASNKWYYTAEWTTFDGSAFYNYDLFDMKKSGGQYVACGQSNRFGTYQVYLMAVDGSGSKLWTKFIDIASGSSESANALAIDRFGNIYLIGSVQRSVSGNTLDAFLMKVNNVTHNPSWTMFWNFTTPANAESGIDIAILGDTIYCLVKYYNTTRSCFQARIHELTIDGTSLTNRSWGIVSPVNFDPRAITVNSSGYVYIGGNGPSGANHDFHVAIFDSNLNFIKNISYYGTGGVQNPRALDITLDESDGSIYVCGDYLNASVSRTQARIWSFYSNGTMRWARSPWQADATMVNAGTCWNIQKDNSFIYVSGSYTRSSIDMMVANLTASNGAFNAIDFWEGSYNRVDVGYAMVLDGGRLYAAGYSDDTYGSDRAIVLKWKLGFNHAPMLSNYAENRNGGSQATVFRFNITYTDSDGGLPTQMNLILVSETNQVFTYSMTAVNASDTNTIDGKVYTYSTALAPGNWTHYFVSSDGIEQTRYPSGNARIAGPWVNHAPQLSQSNLSPAHGISTATYNFSILWKDADRDAPVSMNVYIDGAPHAMVSNGSTNYTRGVTYYYTTTLAWGVHNYYFNGTDGNYTVLSPTGAPGLSNFGPVVNTAPILSKGAVNATYQYGNADFKFTVTYTDAQNNAPSNIAVVIDDFSYSLSKVNPASMDYTIGVQYKFVTKLGPGTHGYHFECSDGMDSGRLPVSGDYSNATRNATGVYADSNIVVPDGLITPGEWQNATYYPKYDKTRRLDAWIARNSTAMFIAVRANVGTQASGDEELEFWMDEAMMAITDLDGSTESYKQDKMILKKLAGQTRFTMDMQLVSITQHISLMEGIGGLT